MNTEHTTKAPIIVGFIVLLGVIGGTYYFSTKDNAGPTTPLAQIEPGSVLPADTMRITAKHSFSNGHHIIAGEVEVPNPCTSLNTSTRIAESSPEQVTVEFTTTGEGDICAQVIATRRFKVEFDSAQNASIKATWNRQEVILNLIEAAPGEDLENFDIYFKG